MNLFQAYELVKDWEQNYFPGRIKTNLHKLAEIRIKNPLRYHELTGESLEKLMHDERSFKQVQGKPKQKICLREDFSFLKF